MRTLITLIAAAALGFSAQTLAHSDEYLDGQPTPHGGQMRMAGLYHFELVVKPGELTVYVTDHGDQPIATDGASGSATLLAGGQRSQIKLSPAGDNRLQGTGAFAMDEQMRAVLSIQFPGQGPEQARFTPLAPRPGQANISEAHDHAAHEHHH